jgi:hypothetical protein
MAEFIITIVRTSIPTFPLKMKVIISSETSVHIRTTRCYNTEDGRIHNYRCENLNSYISSELTNQNYFNMSLGTKSLGRYSSLADSDHGVCLLLGTKFTKWRREKTICSSSKQKVPKQLYLPGYIAEDRNLHNRFCNNLKETPILLGSLERANLNKW